MKLIKTFIPGLASIEIIEAKSKILKMALEALAPITPEEFQAAHDKYDQANPIGGDNRKGECSDKLSSD